MGNKSKWMDDIKIESNSDLDETSINSSDGISIRERIYELPFKQLIRPKLNMVKYSITK